MCLVSTFLMGVGSMMMNIMMGLVLAMKMNYLDSKGFFVGVIDLLSTCPIH